MVLCAVVCCGGGERGGKGGKFLVDGQHDRMGWGSIREVL